jgi:hypothetical protein
VLVHERRERHEVERPVRGQEHAVDSRQRRQQRLYKFAEEFLYFLLVGGVFSSQRVAKVAQRGRCRQDCSGARGCSAPAKFQPVKGEAKVGRTASVDISRAALEAFANAASGGPAYPIPLVQVIQGVAATEAIIRSGNSGKVEHVQ